MILDTYLAIASSLYLQYHDTVFILSFLKEFYLFYLFFEHYYLPASWLDKMHKLWWVI